MGITAHIIREHMISFTYVRNILNNSRQEDNLRKDVTHLKVPGKLGVFKQVGFDKSRERFENSQW